eukprot:GHVT01099779.1.p1 GENE.GHVT01099779.1~~GHVT01099779.1.p1  ORF type:complete len:120 (-),score=7.01 GHVT01099779.1:805-1164(-)
MSRCQAVTVPAVKRSAAVAAVECKVDNEWLRRPTFNLSLPFGYRSSDRAAASNLYINNQIASFSDIIVSRRRWKRGWRARSHADGLPLKLLDFKDLKRLLLIKNSVCHLQFSGPFLLPR